jgi:hypothetical protein
LRVAYDKHSDVIAVETDLAFEGLHGEAGFRQLIAKVGLPPLGAP